MKPSLPLPLVIASLLGAHVATAQNWTAISTPVTSNLILYDIDFPAAQDDIGYAGGSNVTYNGHGTLLKTVDQGNTWSVAWSSTASGTGITALYFLNADTGFAGTQGGNIMKTTDGGTTWSSTDFDSANDQGDINDLQFHDADHGVLTTSYNGIYHTSDGGATWEPATTNPGMGQYALCYADATTLFSCGNDQSIYKSTDGGATWASSFQGTFQTVSLGIDFLDADHGMVTSEEGQYFKTTDGGATWTPGTIPGQSGLMRGVVMLDLDNIFVCATPGQVFRTQDGGTTWTDDSGVNFDPSYYAILFTPNGTGFVCGSGATGGTILKRTPLTTAVADRTVGEAAFTIYPNPVSSSMTVEFSNPLGGRVEVTVVNGLGEVVRSKRVTAKSVGTSRAEVDLSNCAAGRYTVNLIAGGAVIGSRNITVAGR
ncbi:MAG: T9SS type A sorting domain-containing protein [Bacteroidetes bacterium]|nr:T9SS type A sorting domain-containing protein [Bacteroidota bacterium]